VVRFEDCEVNGPVEAFLTGDYLYIDRPYRVSGLQRAGGGSLRDPAVDCLVRLLRPFFPSTVSGEHQARPYIRTTAIGRGLMPEGAPEPKTLITILKSAGFTDGGREGHLYAPYSSVAGNKSPALRSELSAFLRDRTKRSATVSDLITRIRQNGTWPRPAT
jgi:hypothetical protein